METKPPKKRKGGPQPGSGRPKGKLNAATIEIREICRSITLGNPEVVARLTREAKLGTINPSVLINLIDRGWGRPIPMEAEAKEARPPFVFMSQPQAGVHMPWCYAVDRSRHPRSDIAIIHDGPCLPTEPNAIQAPPAKALEAAVIDAGAADAKATKPDEPEGDGEGLESVVPPPELFNPPLRERDRGRSS